MLDKFIRWIHTNETTSREIRTEALLTSNGKCNEDVAVVGMLGHQEMKKLNTNSIMFVAVSNNEMNAVSNLSCNHEIGIYGITCHIGKFINNGGMHGIVVMVDGKMLASIVMRGKAADISTSKGTESTNAKGLFISCSIAQDLGTLLCTQAALVETG